MKRLIFILVPIAIILSGSYLEPKLNFTDLFKTSISRINTEGERDFKLNYGKTLEIDLQTGADIKISGWDKELVNVKSSFSGRDADNIELSFDESTSGLKISTDFLRIKNNNSSSGRIELKVPKKLSVLISTMGGDVTVEGLNGKLEGRTMGGDLSFSKLDGNLDFTTMGGKVSLTNSNVNGHVKTMGGEVIVEDVTGDVNAESMGGKVIQKNVKSSGNSGSEVKIKTMGGPIELDEALNGADVSTMGGEISIGKVNKFLIAETMGGNITVEDLDGWVKAKTMGGDIEVIMTGGTEDKKDVNLTSMSGDIYLTVPKDLDMDIVIEIIYDEDEEVKLESDFDLNRRVEESERWGHSKKLIATGKAGSGKNQIKIKTVNGEVYLKQK